MSPGQVGHSRVTFAPVRRSLSRELGPTQRLSPRRAPICSAPDPLASIDVGGITSGRPVKARPQSPVHRTRGGQGSPFESARCGRESLVPWPQKILGRQGVQDRVVLLAGLKPAGLGAVCGSRSTQRGPRSMGRGDVLVVVRRGHQVLGLQPTQRLSNRHTTVFAGITTTSPARAKSSPCRATPAG